MDCYDCTNTEVIDGVKGCKVTGRVIGAEHYPYEICEEYKEADDSEQT